MSKNNEIYVAVFMGCTTYAGVLLPLAKIACLVGGAVEVWSGVQKIGWWSVVNGKWSYVKA